MEKFFAQIISVVFHPLIMPLAGVFLIFHSGTYFSIIPFESQKIMYILVFFGTFLFPLLIAPFFIYRNLIKSLQMDDHRERILPMALTLIFYYFSYYFLKKIQSPGVIEVFMLSATITLTLALFISLKWKISTHMIGIGGVTGMLVCLSFRLQTDMQILLMILFLVAGLTGYARLRMNKHSPLQILSGYCLGFIIQFAALMMV